MKEIPFLQHYPLLPLPTATNDGNAVARHTAPALPASSGRNLRRRVVAASVNNHGANDEGASSFANGGGCGGAIGLVLTDHSQRAAEGNEEDSSSNACATSLVPAVSLDDDDASPPHPRQFHDPDSLEPNDEESHTLLRGTSSIRHWKGDDRVIFTSGYAGRPGRICVSVRDAAPASGSVRGGDSGGNNNAKATCRDLEVDLSPLMNETMAGGTALFENPVGTACFVTTISSNNDVDDDSPGDEDADTMGSSPSMMKPYVHLRAVDPYGTVLSLTFSYPDLTPLLGQSFLLPLSPRGGSHLHPHPGSSIEINQVCFPAPNAVVFALNPHLYCVDLGKFTGTNSTAEGGGGAAAAVATTRVWTNIHRVVCDPILANSSAVEEVAHGGGVATPTPRKKARKSTFGSIFTSLIGIGDSAYGDKGEFEYHDDGYAEDGGGGGGGYDNAGSMIPSIAALTNLPSLATPSAGSEDDDVARVVTLHSDGSLRVWMAQPSQETEGNNKWRLRIPSVQRVAVPSQSNSWMTSEVGHEDPSIPHPSMWDPTCRGSDAIVLCGRCEYDSRSEGYEYEVAMYIQCCPSGRNREESKNVYVFQGSVVDANAYGNDELPSGDVCAKMQEMVLPTGTRSVADISWSGSDGDLMVLLRCQNHNANVGNAADFYDIGERGKQKAKTALALYPSLGRWKYSKDSVLPPNTTLPCLDLNHFGYSSLGLSVEEELDRYLTISANRGTEDRGTEDKDEYMEAGEAMNHSSTTGAPDDAAFVIAKAEAKIDRAGLLAILQPFGRCRPSTLAVHRAMLLLGLVDKNEVSSSVRPAAILLAMRKWKKLAAFQQIGSTSNNNDYVLSSALVPANGNGESKETSPLAGGLSIYHAFASATKNGKPVNHQTDRWNEVDEDCDVKSGANDVERAQIAHRLRWVRLLSEICRQENRLHEVLCLGSTAASSFTNFLIRGSGISVLTVDEDVHGEQGVGDTMAGKLDELSVQLLSCIMSNPELRQLFCRVDSLLYDGASKASFLVNDSSGSPDRELMSQVQLLGGSAVASISLHNAQIQLLGDLSSLRSNFAEAWLTSPLSSSSSVSALLAISRPLFATMPNEYRNDTREASYCEVNDVLLSSASSLVCGHLESIRLLSLSRLILVAGSPQRQGSHLRMKRSALRSVLYSTALSWAVHQTSSMEKRRTVLEEHLSQVVKEGSSFDLAMAAALPLADTFVASAFRYYANETSSDGALSTLNFSPSREPRVALRLLAPFVNYPPQSISPTLQDVIHQKRREAAAECLLAEAAAIAKQSGTVAANGTSLGALWNVASKLLLPASADNASQISNLTHRAEVLERHLNLMEGSTSHLPIGCGVVLDAIRDAISSVSSSQEMREETPTLWSIAFQTAMRGHLWHEALRACVNNPLSDKKKTDLKRLILGMVDADSLGKIVDMSLTVRELSTPMLGDNDQEVIAEGTITTGVDLFDLAAEVMEEAAYEQASISLGSETQEESAVKDRPNYWGCLYTLHASRGNWTQAAYAMDMCGKATANSVSSTLLNPQKPLILSKVASKKIMDDACLSAQACVHALSLVDKSSQRYLLPTGSNQCNIPSESRLLTEEDLERRATRALALRMYSMDKYSPDSIGEVLKSTSRDTIDSLALLGYYDQAISVASGFSSKRKGLPGGVDLFDDALKHILCTHIVPVATKPRAAVDGGGGLERSKVAQIRASSSACALLGSANNTPSPQSCITPSSVNSMSWGSNAQSGKTLQTTMAMDLLQQYTTAYSVKCRSLALYVASAILQSDDASELPPWLKELCIFGSNPQDEKSNTCQIGLFAQQPTPLNNSIIADPVGLIRLFIKHHQYGEACDVVVSILSKQTSQKYTRSSRLPENGNIDWAPYDLIDMLWNIIESILTNAAYSNSSEEDVKIQVKSLIKKRTRMENALEKHFVSLRISEKGLKSTRRLSSA